MEHFDTICNSPSQIYHSALPFSPSSSWLRNYYTTELSQEVKVVRGLLTEWGTCFRTVALHGYPWTLVCWKDTIAVGLQSGDITTLNGITGIQVAILSGHTGGVGSLAFSSDGTLLVSGSDDKTIKLWDIQTGGVINTFHGHNNCVLSVSISVDCTTIASGSDDKMICLWDIQTRECHYLMEQQEQVDCVSFSPADPHYLISISGGMVKQWDMDGHQIHPTYEGSHLVFSLDGTQFVSCQGAAVVVQNSSSGAIVAKNGSKHHCCCSPDDKLAALAVGSTVYIWDITSSDPYLVETFIGHTDDITSLTFSSPSSLISSSDDKSVKFWQICTSLTNSVTDLRSMPLSPSPIKTITLQVRDAITISTDSDGVVRTWDLSTGQCKASFQTPAKKHRWADVQLIDSKLIFVWFMGRKLHIWDVEKGELLQTADGPRIAIRDIRISGDGSKVFYLTSASIWAWAIWTEGVLKKVGDGFVDGESLVVNGSKVWVYSSSGEPQGWDFGIPGSPPIQLSNVPLLYAGDTKLWDTGLFRVKDTATGKVVLQLVGRYVRPVDVQWDGQYLVAGYVSGEVLILEFNRHLPLQ